MKHKLKIALLGLGTVGSGVYELIESTEALHSKVEIVKVLVKNLDKKRNINDMTMLTNQIDDDFLKEIDIMIETMGGLSPAYEITKKALSLGIHVITSNKELVDTHFDELLKLASTHECSFLYEASVLAGIPIIQTLHQIAQTDQITHLTGIFNGSTNYLLTRLFKDGYRIEDALDEAKRLGYLEADPKDDVMGFDALRKTMILSRIAFHTSLTSEQCFRKGIDRLSNEFIDFVKSNDYILKLICNASLNGEELNIEVIPTLLSYSHPFSQINDEFNIIEVDTTSRGKMTWIGKGAGKFVTAQGILSDLNLLIGQGSYQAQINQTSSLKLVNSQVKSTFIIEMTQNVLPQSLIIKQKGNIYQTIEMTIDQLSLYLDKIVFYAKVV